jgi:hypothetical protein
VHTMTTDWVLDGHNESFPLMYHHRILPQTAQPLPEELRDIDKAVEYWEGSSAVRARIEALEQAKSAAAIIIRNAPLAVVMGEFFGKLQRESRLTPYPTGEIAAVR